MTDNVGAITDPQRGTETHDELDGFNSGPPVESFFRMIVDWTHVSAGCAAISLIFRKNIGALAGPFPVFSILEKGVELLSYGFLIVCTIGSIGIIGYLTMECFKRIFPCSDVSPALEIPRHEVVVQRFSQHYQFIHRANRDREHRWSPLVGENIPVEFEGDGILGQFICPITHAPIRHPVKDPTTGTVYERTAIEAWIAVHHNSPTSERPLEREDLVPARDVQEIIDNQLRVLEAERTAMEQEMREDLDRQQHEYDQEIARQDALRREAIPEEFEDDLILRQYVCPITRAPIRHPVIDPTSATLTSVGTMYERDAIEEWVNRSHRSPLTRKHLEINDLVPGTNVQSIIDNRLRELQHPPM